MQVEGEPQEQSQGARSLGQAPRGSGAGWGLEEYGSFTVNIVWCW